MLQELFQDVFLMDIPLPRTPLKNLNCYFIRGKERNLLIDTGFNNEICYEALMSGFQFLGADLEQTDIFLTHLHSDHSGLSDRLKTRNNQVWMGARDLDCLNALTSVVWDTQFLRPLGLSPEEIRLNQDQNPAVTYSAASTQGITPIADGTEFQAGQYRLRAVETPGHTPGHMCLYDSEHRLLFCGDHLLYGITPNISSWPGVDNSLGDYLNSLRAILDLDAEYAFVGHRKPLGDYRARAAKLIHHHGVRLKEALRLVARGSGVTAYQTASGMTWSIRAKSWNHFPVTQRVFATCEAAAHLEYLLAEGCVTRQTQDGVTHYFAVPDACLAHIPGFSR